VIKPIAVAIDNPKISLRLDHPHFLKNPTANATIGTNKAPTKVIAIDGNNREVANSVKSSDN
jgi:hypothetical protein